MRAPHVVLVVAAVFGTERAMSSQVAPDRPFVLSSTYWGGSQSEDFAAVVTDGLGNVYVAGTTTSADFPRTVATLPARGPSDVFVSKFNAAGTLVFSTVFGGSAGELVNALAVDGSGHIIVVGKTFSSDLPVMNPIHPAFHLDYCDEFGGICPDAFVSKLSPNGQSLIFSTYLGTNGEDNALDVAVDSGGSVYVSGQAAGPFAGLTPVRAFSGGRDAFVVKIPPGGGTYTYVTFLGGSSSDIGNGIDVDATGSAYVTGVTASQNFPTLNPIQAAPENFSDSAFVTKLNPAGGIAYSTYLSGHSTDSGVDIRVDALGRAHVVGLTASTNFPIVNAGQPFLRGFNDAFVAKLSASGSSLHYSTYLGGNDREQAVLDFSPALNLALDANGNAFVTGQTQSSDFPALYPLQPFGGGQCVTLPFFDVTPCPDAFVSKLNPEGRLEFSTPVGGNRSDRGRGVAVAGDGLVYVTGNTSSANFPIRSAQRPALSGTSDAFITKMWTAPPGCQLPAPVQLSPSGGIAEPQPVFSWEPVAGAQFYLVFAFNFAQAMLTGTPPVHVLGATTSTRLTPAPIAAGDYNWQVVPWNIGCGWGKVGSGKSFTLPGACPIPPATQISPVGGAVVSNPTRFEWSIDPQSVASISVVIILRAFDGQLVAQYPTAGNSLTMPTTLSSGDYAWVVASWNSTCGATVSPGAFFRSTGGVTP